MEFGSTSQDQDAGRVWPTLIGNRQTRGNLDRDNELDATQQKSLEGLEACSNLSS